MSLNILIVEDQFIEANDLKLILEKAGHRILGIAKSVDQAMILLGAEKPEIVLLDIYLKGHLTGIDLAQILTSENIPFVYLTANSSESIFEAAKATNPYGFLVKPFREKDILAALDIASYRHKHTVELVSKQDRWLRKLLTNIIQEKATVEQKLLMLCKSFRPFIYFDFMIVDVSVEQDGPSSVYSFQRLQYDDYEVNNSWHLVKKLNTDLPDLNNFRKNYFSGPDIVIQNETDFLTDAENFEVIGLLRSIYHVTSSLSVPLFENDKLMATIHFFNLQQDYYKIEHAELLHPLKELIYTVVEHVYRQKNTKTGFSNKSEKDEEDVQINKAFSNIIGKSPLLLKVLDQVSQVAPFDTTVLILGDTGVGKEGIAHALHHLSERKLKPFIKINCAAIPSTLVESALFGHEAGSFTGASEQHIGKFEQAQGGTVFLDEIGEIPLEIQSKLLRVLQEKELERIGGRTTIKMDVRIIAATNRNLYQEVAAGKFRIDLYYRINVFPIKIPSLFDRREDIPLLANYFLSKNMHLSGGKIKELSPGALSQLMNYEWPGNIREMQHLIERHILMNSSDVITNIELPETVEHTAENLGDENNFQTIADLDRAHILAVLKKCNGKVSGRGGAAEILQIPSTTLTSKMKKLGIARQY